MFAVASPVLPSTIPARPTLPTSGYLREVGSGKTYPGTQTGLQDAIDDALPGDIIQVTAGTVITVGATPIIMRRKGASSDYITIRSSGYSSFTEGIRAGAADTGAMFKLVKSGTAGRLICIEFLESAGEYAHNYIWQGLEATGSHTTGSLTVMISLLRDNTLGACTDQSWEARDIHFMHSYIHGDATHNYRVGWEPGCLRAGMWDSTIVEFHEVGADSQAVNTPSGTGAVVIDNCKLQGAGEVLMWGGGTQQMSNVNGLGYVVRRSDLSWDPAWKGGSFTLKNLLELKHFEQHLIEACTLHGCWKEDQSGQVFAIKENSAGDSWNRMRNVTIRNCKIYDGQGFASLVTLQGGGGGLGFSGMSDLLIENCGGWNLNATEGGGSVWEGMIECTPSAAVKAVQLMRRIYVRKSTLVHDDCGSSSATGGAAIRWVNDNASGFFDHWYLHDNVMTLWGASDSSRYGFSSADPSKSQRLGQGALEYSVPNYDFRGNLWIGDYPEANFPSGNTKAIDYAAAKFVNWAGGDLRLASDSPGKGAGISGGDAGCDWDTLDYETRGCLSGNWVN